MASAKFLFLMAVVGALSVSVSGQFLNYFFPTIMQKEYQFVPSKEGYRFNIDDPNGSTREEIGMIMNPGTDKEELVVMGTLMTYDEKSEIETLTMYTADKNGYKARYMLKNRRLSPGALKSAAG